MYVDSMFMIRHGAGDAIVEKDEASLPEAIAWIASFRNADHSTIEARRFEDNYGVGWAFYAKEGFPFRCCDDVVILGFALASQR